MKIDSSGSAPRLRIRKTADTVKRASLAARFRKSRAGRTRAAAAFIAALSRMQSRATARAKIKAEEQARERLARELADIKAADDVIVGIAALLPLDLRKRVAEARKTLTAKIMGLGKTVPGNDETQKSSTLRSGERPDDVE